MDHIARLRLLRDRFIAGHDSCALCRHLDSVAPETPIRYIVDRCRVWESHADTEARRFSKRGPEIYTVDEPGCGLDDHMVAVLTVPPAVPDQLEILLRRLLPNKVVPASPPKPEPTELGCAGTEAHSKTGITDMETLLQGLLPGMPAAASRVRPGPICRDWATVVCFSCGKAGHGVGLCPKLNETFPFMLPGWTAEKVGNSYVMISPQVAAERRRAENGD